MKIYFAGPLFTPYVRGFISEHARILRENGIQPFVPHEKFNAMITPEKVAELVAHGALSPGEVPEPFDPEAIMNLQRQGRLTRNQLDLPEIIPETIYDIDYEGLSGADAVLAILDGTQVDDGTACEIGIFYQLMQQDPGKKGIIGLMTDSRGSSRKSHGWGLNMFVLGVLEAAGGIYDNFADALDALKALEAAPRG